AGLAGLLHQRAGRAIHLGDDRDRVAERPRAQRHHHEVLHVDAPAGVRCAAAAACATAIDTATVALPPSLPLFGVPSSATIAASTAAWSSASMPPIARAMPD